MRRDIAELFELDPALTHLNHGAFGAVPRSVREAQDRARARIEGRRCGPSATSCPSALAEPASGGRLPRGAGRTRPPWCATSPRRSGWCSRALGIGPGDEVVVSNHGYLTAGWSVEARGATLRTAAFAVEATPAAVVAAFAAAVTDRTRLVVIDQITSPTALVLPVAEVAAAVAPVPVLVDAAHVPGALPGLDVEALGVAFWAGNLHKWAYTPRAAAALWVAPQHRDRDASARHLLEPRRCPSPSASTCRAPSTTRRGSPCRPASPPGTQLGGWEQVRRNADLLVRGAEHVRDALGTESPHGGIPSAPCLRVVALPPGVATTTGGRRGTLAAAACRRASSCRRWRSAGVAYLRLAAAPYNDEDDYARLADVLRDLLRGPGARREPPSMRPMTGSDVERSTDRWNAAPRRPAP